MSAPETNFLEIDSAGDALNWAGYTLGNLAPMMATSIAGGGVGGLLAKKGIQQSAAAMTARLVSQGMAKEAAAKEAGAFVAKRVALGQALGASAASVGMSTGSIYGETEDAAVSAVHGLIAGSIDALPIMRLFDRFGASKVAKEALETSVIREIGKQGIREAGTEGVQTFIEQHANYWVENEGRSLLGNLEDADWNEILEAFAAGALGGGVMGGGASAIGGDPMLFRKPTVSKPEDELDKAIGNAERAAQETLRRGGDALDAELARAGTEEIELPQAVLNARETARKLYSDPAPTAPLSPQTIPGQMPTFPSAQAPRADQTIPGQWNQPATSQASSIPENPAIDPLIAVARRTGDDTAVARLEAAKRMQALSERFASEGNQQRATNMAERATAIVDDVRGKLPAEPEQAQEQPAAGERISIWTGRRGDGYETTEAAEAGLATRQRVRADLDWRVERMPSGKYQLSGYSQQGQPRDRLAQPDMQAVDSLAQAKAQGEAQRAGQPDPAVRQMQGAAIDRAMKSIESRGGVATQAEADLLAEYGMGAPFDRIEGPAVQPTETLRMSSSGKPFQSEKQARSSVPYRQNPGATVVASGDGFAVQLPAVKDTEKAIARAQSLAAPQEGDGQEWSTFAPETGTLNVPRETMPQIKAEHRGAMVNFLKGQFIESEMQTIPANTLKPTQTEFSTAKVKQALEYKGGNRSILVSSDNYVIDGHHQWLANLDGDIRVIRIDAPAQEILDVIKKFPSATTGEAKPQGGQSSQIVQFARTAKSLQEVRDYVRREFGERGAKALDAAAVSGWNIRNQERRRRVNKDDSLVVAVAKLGGISPEWQQDITGDTKANKMIPGVGQVFSKSGTSPDDMAVRLFEEGYITQEQLDDMDARDVIYEAINGELSGGKKKYKLDSDKAIEEQLQAIEDQYADETAELENRREQMYRDIEQEHGAETAELARLWDIAADQAVAQLLEDAAIYEDQSQEIENVRQASSEADLNPEDRAPGDERVRQAAAGQDRQPAETGRGQEQASPGQRVEQESPRTAASSEAVVVSGQQESRPRTQKEASTAPGQITDFGEKLGGARKDRDRMASMTTEMTVEDIAKKSLSEIWPKSEVDAIEDKDLAAFAHGVRSEIPSKPRRPYAVKSWAEKIAVVRGLVQEHAESAEKVEQMMRNGSDLLKGFIAKVDILRAIDREQWNRIGSVAFWPNAFRYDEDGGKVPSPTLSVVIDDRRQSFSVSNIEDAIDGINEKLGSASPSSSVKFEIRGYRKDNDWFIIKKGDSEYRKLKSFSGETALADAKKYMQQNASDLEAAWEAIKERDNIKKTDVRNEENRPRTGKDYRRGKDVTPEQFTKEFGFRGVEFGNWVTQGKNAKERQGMLNQAYDALMDLAEIVGIPPKAISLNGSMGLAFGSRGSGSASAHFEPGNLVINLTKTRGAGTLAHEWFHALDNYFQRARGTPRTTREGSYITYKPEPMYVHKTARMTPLTKAKLDEYHKNYPTAGVYNPDNWMIDPNHPEGVRPQVERSFAQLVETLEASPMKKRASIIDKDKVDGYWSRIIERAARSFENYVITKMHNNGYDNDYLANVKDWESWGEKNPERYPYLKPDEIAPVAEAFDALFSTIKTRETETGVALFSRQMDGRDSALTFERFNDLGADKSVSLDQTLDDIESIMGFRSPFDIAYSERLDADVPMAFDLDARIILVNKNRSMNRTEAAQYMAEEVLHGIDAVGANRTISASSKLLAVDGAVRTEVQDAFERGTLVEFLRYPMDRLMYAGLSDDRIRAELFARLGVLYLGEPQLMREVLPIAYRTYSQIFGLEKESPVSGDYVFRNVWGASESKRGQVRGEYRTTSQAGRNDPGADGKGGAGEGLGRIRQAVGRSLRGTPLGVRANLKDMQTRPSAGFSISGGAKATAIPIDRAQALVSAITGRLENAPETIVVQNMQDAQVPEAVRREDARQRSQGASGEPEGFYYQGKAYIVLDGLSRKRGESDAQALLRVFSHEVLGHAGLRGLFRGDLEKVLNEVAMKRLADVRKKAAEYGLNLADRNQRMEAAEEVLAEMAQAEPENSLVVKAVEAIRKALRKLILNLPADVRAMIGGLQFVKWINAMSDAEIINRFIVPAREYIRGGQSGASGDAAPAFQRVEEGGTISGMEESGLEKQGFDTNAVWLHGSDSEFDQFDTSKGGANFGDEASRQGIFFTDSQGGASFYGSKINRFIVRKGNHKVITEEDISQETEAWLDELEENDPKQADYQRATKAYQNSKGVNKGFELAILKAKQNGFDSTSYKDEYGETTLVVFDPKNVRSAKNLNLGMSDDFAFNQYTEEEISQREQMERDRKALTAKALQKQAADDQLGEFTLTGSDSVADQAAARGQGSLFSRSQSLPETISINGTDRPTTNSNGQPIAQTEEGVRNFWRWFGDGNMVDDSGRPIVLYHGTDKDFSEFKPRKGLSGRASYFSTDPRASSQYAEGKVIGKKRAGSAVVMPVYVRGKILRQDAFSRTDAIAIWEAVDQKEQKKWDKLAAKGWSSQSIDNTSFLIEMSDEDFDSSYEKKREFIEAMEAMEGVGLDAASVLSRMGYDGTRGDEHFYDNEGNSFGEYVAVASFNPGKNVKSAIGNNGTFGVADSDIRFSQSSVSPRQESKEFRDWFKKSKVQNGQGEPLTVYHGTKSQIDSFRPGSWFAEDAKLANTYVGGGRRASPKAQKGSNVVPAFLSIQNPLDVTGRLFDRTSIREILTKEGFSESEILESFDYMEEVAAQKHEKGENSNRDGRQYGTLSYGAEQQDKLYALDKKESLWSILDDSVFRAAMQRLGYDGVKADEKINAGDDPVVIWQVFSSGQVKSAIGNTGTFDPADSDIRFSRRDSTGFAVPDETLVSVAIRKIQDKFKVLKDLQKNIREAGGKINEDNDTYLAEELFHGKAENDLREMQEQYVEPLANKMAQFDIDRDALDQYLYARHARERNDKIARINPDMPDGGSGMTNAQAQEILSSVRESGKLDQYDQLAAIVYDMLKLQRDMIREGGLESDLTMDAWEDGYQFYVPLKGWAEDTKQEGMPRTGKGFNIGGRESKRALGRSSQAASPTSYAIIDLTEKLIRRRKNEVGNALLKLVRDNPNPSYWQVFTDERPETQRTVKKVKDPETGEMVEQVAETAIPMAMLSDRYFTTKKKGKTFYIKLEDPRLMKAMKNLGPESNGALIRTMAGVTRVMSALNTSYSPEFMISNFARDVQTALLNLQAEQSLPAGTGKAAGQKIAAKTLKDIPSAMKAIFESLRGNTLDTAQGKRWQEIFEQFRQDGAKTGWFDMKDLDGQSKTLDNMVSIAKGGFKGKALTYARDSAKLVENLNQAVENAVRLAAYANAIEAGISRKQAASLAKNMTVNFNRRGEIGTVLNSLYMFANASIQGTANLVRTMGTFKGDGSVRWSNLNNAQKLAAGIVAGAYFIGMANRMAAGEDEDDENWFDKIPDYVKERNIVLMKSMFGGPQDGSYWKIPLPYGYNVFSVLGTSVESVLGGKRPVSEAAADIAIATLGSFSPIGFQDSDSLANMFMKNAAPTLIKPIVEIGLNENFMGSSIYTENLPFGTPKPDSALGRNSTPELYRQLSRWMNEVTGGSEYRPGAIDVNPDVMQHFLDYFGGSAYNFFGSKVPDAIHRSASGVVAEENRVPFLSRISGRVLPYGDTEKFYNRRDEINQVLDEYQALPPEQRGQFEGRAMLRMRPLLKATEKQLSALRKRRDTVYSADLPLRERDPQLKAIEAKMKEVVDRFNRAYNAIGQ